MRYRLTFLLGVGAGYVLGARAGRGQYDQMMRSLRDAKEQPAVQSAAGVVTAQAAGLAEKARSAVTAKASGDSSAAVGTSQTYPSTPLNADAHGLNGTA